MFILSGFNKNNVLTIQFLSAIWANFFSFEDLIKEID